MIHALSPIQWFLLVLAAILVAAEVSPLVKTRKVLTKVALLTAIIGVLLIADKT